MFWGQAYGSGGRRGLFHGSAALTGRRKNGPGGEDAAPLAPLAAAPLSRRGRDYRTRRILVTADVAALLVGIVLLAGVGEAKGLESHALWAVPTIPVWLMLFMSYGLYSSGLRRVGHSTVDDIPGLAHVFLVGSVGMWLYFQITPAGTVGIRPLLMFASVGFVVDVALRAFSRGLSRRVLGDERILFVGSGPMTPILVRQVLRQPSHGLELVGAVTRLENQQWPLPIESLGALTEIDPATLLRDNRVDRVVVSAEGIEDDLLLEMVGLCRTLGVKVSALPSLAAMIGPAATIDRLEGVTLIGLNLPSLARSSQLLKRAMDIAGASILLVLSAPVCAAVAIAIKLNSPGPILFRQERIGRGGKPFRLNKFRSMVVDAEALRPGLLAQSRQAAWLDLEHDPRITRVGRFLRLSSLDELPQLWNVLWGDMSLVGPRPLIPQEDEIVRGWTRARLDLTPGITGMWQVMGRVHIPFEQMVMIDYLYVANWSLWRDVTLLLRTLPVVLTRRGAN